MSSAARYRKPATTSNSINPVGEQEKAELKAAVKLQAAKTSNGLSVLDILRIIGGVLLLSSGLSYLSTSGESMTWGYNPWWTRAREWKTLLVRPTHPPNPTPPQAPNRSNYLTNPLPPSNTKSPSPTTNSHNTTALTPQNQSTSP